MCLNYIYLYTRINSNVVLTCLELKKLIRIEKMLLKHKGNKGFGSFIHGYMYIIHTRPNTTTYSKTRTLRSYMYTTNLETIQCIYIWHNMQEYVHMYIGVSFYTNNIHACGTWLSKNTLWLSKKKHNTYIDNLNKGQDETHNK